MRTTVTLDDDVAEQVRTLARQLGISFKEALNRTLRAGLADRRSKAKRPFRTQTASLGLRPGVDLNHALRLAAELEDEALLQKLELRK